MSINWHDKVIHIFLINYFSLFIAFEKSSCTCTQLYFIHWQLCQIWNWLMALWKLKIYNGDKRYIHIKITWIVNIGIPKSLWSLKCTSKCAANTVGKRQRFSPVKFNGTIKQQISISLLHFPNALKKVTIYKQFLLTYFIAAKPATTFSTFITNYSSILQQVQLCKIIFPSIY